MVPFLNTIDWRLQFDLLSSVQNVGTQAGEKKNKKYSMSAIILICLPFGLACIGGQVRSSSGVSINTPPTIVKILLTLKMQSYLYLSILHSRNMAEQTPFQRLINWLISTGYVSQLSMKGHPWKVESITSKDRLRFSTLKNLTVQHKGCCR